MRDKLYGAWIDPQGKLIQCPDQCLHTQYCQYPEANDEGWIALSYGKGCYDVAAGRSFGDSIRFNPDTVTEAALRELLRYIRKDTGEETFYLSDIWTNSFKGMSQGITKAATIAFLRETLTRRTMMEDKEKKPLAAEVWKENDNRRERFILITQVVQDDFSDRGHGKGWVEFFTCTRGGVVARGDRKHKAKLARFNGKSGGYSYFGLASSVRTN